MPPNMGFMMGKKAISILLVVEKIATLGRLLESPLFEVRIPAVAADSAARRFSYPKNAGRN
jgi:hypothetical protein